MKYKSGTNFPPDTPEQLGVLLLNLGTPEAPTPSAVRRYLAEFLNDPRVVEVPRPLWWVILHGVILRIRPARSAKAYRAVWTDRGSPMLEVARRQAAGLQERLLTRVGPRVRVALGMRYGQPSVLGALEQLRDAHVRRLLVLPLYPQYSATTTASSFDAVTDELSTWRWLPELRFVNQYHDEPGYIDALATSIRAAWATHGQPDRLLFSFHGTPQRYFTAGDPYHCHCHKTARLVATQLALPDDRWLLAFQSRIGRDEWLQPYTDQTLKAWAQSGIKHVQVIAPGFSADCLETLEEIAVENRDAFLAAGGEQYHYIPCLNDLPAHLDMLAGLVQRHTCGWPERTAGGTSCLHRQVAAASNQSASAAVPVLPGRVASGLLAGK
ncbi:ferrochelatase [Thiospirillum jenense]|uniref:Ferrochelatase n=1 Tax=Thiospirillum jenense TaxID=1653858 RepID=A0A839H5Z8_9GAMM|nr:ferrochelatase [Thiospirillum jenense]MBB1125303.1 ferrochelatase [Thiospirillum jenense]